MLDRVHGAGRPGAVLVGGAGIYDFKTGCVKTECLHEGWQTSGSVKVVRMAYNLYCNGTPSVLDYDDAEEQVDECRLYTVEELFCCAYAPYFWQAVQIRYTVNVPSRVIADTKTIYKRFVVHVLIPDLFQFLVVEFFMCIADKNNRFLFPCS